MQLAHDKQADETTVSESNKRRERNPTWNLLQQQKKTKKSLANRIKYALAEWTSIIENSELTKSLVNRIKYALAEYSFKIEYSELTRSLVNRIKYALTEWTSNNRVFRIDKKFNKPGRMNQWNRVHRAWLKRFAAVCLKSKPDKLFYFVFILIVQFFPLWLKNIFLKIFR